MSLLDEKKHLRFGLRVCQVVTSPKQFVMLGCLVGYMKGIMLLVYTYIYIYVCVHMHIPRWHVA